MSENIEKIRNTSQIVFSEIYPDLVAKQWRDVRIFTSR